MTATFNFSRNDDIAYVASAVHAALAHDRSTFLTPRGSTGRANSAPGAVAERFKPFKSSSIKQIFNVASVLASAREIRSADRVVVASPSILNVIVVVLALILRRPLIAAVHDVDPHYGGLRGAFYRFQNEVLFRTARSVLVFSEYSRRRAATRYGHPHLIVVPLPSPAEVVTSAADRVPEPTHDFVWFGRLEEYKGADLLAPFAERIRAHGMRLLVLTSAAPAGPLQPLEMLPNVDMIARSFSNEELAALVRQARFNICPYVEGTQSGVVAFCNALGVPSICHDVGGLSEQLYGGRSGFTVPSILDLDLQAVRQRSDQFDPSTIRATHLEQAGWDALVKTVRAALR